MACHNSRTSSSFTRDIGRPSICHQMQGLSATPAALEASPSAGDKSGNHHPIWTTIKSATAVGLCRALVTECHPGPLPDFAPIADSARWADVSITAIRACRLSSSACMALRGNDILRLKRKSRFLHALRITLPCCMAAIDT